MILYELTLLADNILSEDALNKLPNKGKENKQEVR
jgi:hypothetical protein